MLILPEENQLVKVTLSQEAGPFKGEYSMILDKPRGDVWLPRECSAYDKSPTSHIRRSREFHDYAETGVRARFWFEDVKVKIWYETDKAQPKP